MGSKQKNGSSTTLEPLASVEAANAAAAQARKDAIAQLTEQRAGLVSQIEELAGQVLAIDEGMENDLGVEEFGPIDLSVIAYAVDLGTTPKRQRRSSGKSSDSSGSGGPRGSKPTSLANGILITMNQSRKGTEFSPSDLADAVAAAPVNYPFSGENATTQVSQTLSRLLKAGHVNRTGRGIYVITGDGQTVAKEALSDMNSEG